MVKYLATNAAVVAATLPFKQVLNEYEKNSVKKYLHQDFHAIFLFGSLDHYYRLIVCKSAIVFPCKVIHIFYSNKASNHIKTRCSTLCVAIYFHIRFSKNNLVIAQCIQG